MQLPMPNLDGAMSLEKAIAVRRTVRSFLSRPMDLDQFSQLLWAAQGKTDEKQYKRTAPSAGALYPMDVYAVAGEGTVEKLGPGIYRYESQGHEVQLKSEGDVRSALARACLSQMWMASAPLDLVVTADYGRICGKYGERGVRYALMEAGHIGQIIFLQAEALGLGSGIVGAFHDQEVSSILQLPEEHEPLLIIPVGYKSGRMFS